MITQPPQQQQDGKQNLMYLVKATVLHQGALHAVIKLE